MTDGGFPGAMSGTRVAYVVEPRFSGGTSSAVAAELRVMSECCPVVIHARRSAMFGDTQGMAPVLHQTIDALGLPVIWDAPEISADVVIIHNPSFLKFQQAFGARIFARQLIVVTHENFVRPSGIEAFDVGACLAQIDSAALALRKCLAPISTYNRATVQAWLREHRTTIAWDVLDADWFNICETDVAEPTTTPRDRRGRHSRATREKFPPLEQLDLCFPVHAESNVLLGANFLINADIERPHWTLLPFGSTDVDTFLDMIDFYVYFTTPTWRESFGRVIAEALAAGKVVLTDPDTGAIFGDAVIPCQPSDVDRIIDGYLAEPSRYVEQALRAQPVLDSFSAASFRQRLCDLLTNDAEAAG